MNGEHPVLFVEQIADLHSCKILRDATPRSLVILDGMMGKPWIYSANLSV